MNQRRLSQGMIYKITFTQQIWRNCYRMIAPFVSGISFARSEMTDDHIRTDSKISFREYQAETFKFYFSRDTRTEQWSFGCENLGLDMTSGLFDYAVCTALWHFQNGYNLSFHFPYRENIFAYSDRVLHIDDTVKTLQLLKKVSSSQITFLCRNITIILKQLKYAELLFNYI